MRGVVEQFGDPANCLCFNFAGHGGKKPCADILIHGGGKQVAKQSDRRGRRSDISPEARMRIEQRVLKEKVGGAI